jgi:hypothetical protein
MDLQPAEADPVGQQALQRGRLRPGQPGLQRRQLALDGLPGEQAPARDQLQQGLLGVPGQVARLPPDLGPLVQQPPQRVKDRRVALMRPPHQVPDLLLVLRGQFLLRLALHVYASRRPGRAGGSRRRPGRRPSAPC